MKYPQYINLTAKVETLPTPSGFGCQPQPDSIRSHSHPTIKTPFILKNTLKLVNLFFLVNEKELKIYYILFLSELSPFHALLGIPLISSE